VSHAVCVMAFKKAWFETGADGVDIQEAVIDWCTGGSSELIGEFFSEPGGPDRIRGAQVPSTYEG
jgi:hypothetical protein